MGCNVGSKVGILEGEKVGLIVGAVGTAVGLTVGVEGATDGLNVGVAVVGVLVGAKQSGYIRGELGGDDIGARVSLELIKGLHKDDGMVPPKQLLFNLIVTTFVRSPRLLGMLPVREFFSSINDLHCTRFPSDAGTVPVNLFF